MILNLALSVVAGALTIFSPCVLPVAPLVMGASAQSSKWGPAALLGGMILSFAAIGTFISAFLFELGLSPDILTQFGAALLIVVGLFLSLEKLSDLFKQITTGFSNRVDGKLQGMSLSGVRGQFVLGLSIGMIWAPCTGPTLGAAISLAVQGENLFQSFLTMLFFGLGASIPLLFLGLGAKRFAKHRQALLTSSLWLKKLVGGIFVFIGIAIFLGWHKIAETKILEILPDWWVQMITSV